MSCKTTSLIDKLKFSKSGFLYGLKVERTTQILFTVSLLSNIYSLLFVPTIENKIEVIVFSFILLTIEYINTSIETTIDRIGKCYHILSKHAKDLSSVASLLMIIAFSLILMYNIVITYNYYKIWKKDNKEKKSLINFIKSTWVFKSN